VEERRPSNLGPRLNSLAFHVLALAAAGLVAFLSMRYDRTWDWTASQRNSLSQTSREVLTTLEAPPRLIAYVREDPLLRQRVRDLVQRYLRVRPDMKLSFVDPDLHPDLARELGISAPIEILVEYGERREKVAAPTEETLTNAIQRVATPESPWVVGVVGHGERDLLGQANYDLALFGAELERKGFQTESLSLAATPAIPDNTRVLLVAGPSDDLLDAEHRRILDYVDAGGNLLVLAEPGDQARLSPLLGQLGLRLLPGVVVDANAKALGIDDPTFALVPSYPEHPATEGLKSISLFPKAAALEPIAEGHWVYRPLLATQAGSWNETGPIRGEVERDPAEDEHAGPLTLGLALTRHHPGTDREQRVVVIGDGDFLSNAYLGNGGNLDLGLRLVRWLGLEDRMLRIPAHTAPDRTLDLSRWQAGVIGLGFLFVLPMLLLATALAVWWRRRS